MIFSFYGKEKNLSGEKYVIFENGFSNIVDAQGNYLVNNEYKFVDKISEGYARVLKDNKWGFINKKLELKINAKYEYALNFSNGYAAVKINNMWGYIDYNGNEKIKCEYTWASDFENDLAAVNDNGEYYYIDKSGKKIFDKSYIFANQFSEGYAVVQINPNTIEIIDTNGNIIMEFPRKGIMQVGNVHEGAVLVMYKNKLDQGKFKLLDLEGNIIAEEFDGLTNLNKNITFYAIKDNETLQWGVMNIHGTKITAPKFNNVISNLNDSYGVSIIDEKGNEKWGFIDEKGEYILEPSYDSIGTYDGMVAMKTGSKLLWGIVNPYGEYILDCKYEAAYSLE